MLRSIARGDRGPDVLEVQKQLNRLRRPGDPHVDEIGVFGPVTDGAVRRFQERNRLVPDGVVGRLTRAALFPLATVTVQLVGMRLRMPTLELPRSTRPASAIGDAPNPGASGTLTLPPLSPLFGFQPISYPGLFQPLATAPLVPPPVPGVTLPFHHMEVQPGTTVSLGKRFDLSFSMTVSGVVIIGPEKARHEELSSGIAMSTPGVVEGGDWTVGWFAQYTHVEQLGRSGNFSWQPNGQVVAGHGSLPFLSATASLANVQFDATDSLSLSFGGPAPTVTFAPGASTLSWSLASFGIVSKF